MQHPGRALLFVGAAGMVAAGGSPSARNTAAAGPPPAALHAALVDEYCVDVPRRGREEGRPGARHGRARRTCRGTRTCGRRSSGSSAPARCRRSGEDAAGRARPTTRSIASLETSLDRAAAGASRTRAAPTRSGGSPAPSTRTPSAICWRSTIDATALLPADESSYGFDNVTVGDLSPTLLDRYISAAEKISRLAVGRPGRSPGGDTIRDPAGPHPGGARRRAAARHARRRARPLHVPAGRRVRDPDPPDAGPQRARRGPAASRTSSRCCSTASASASFTVTPPQRGAGARRPPIAHLKVRVPVTAGPHELGVTFLKKPSSLLETTRQPYQAHFNMHRHPRISPAVYSGLDHRPVSAPAAPATRPAAAGSSSRPTAPADEEACAPRRSSPTLMRRAYRRPVDRRGPRTAAGALPRGAARRADFDAGIEMALSARPGEPAVPLPHRARPGRRSRPARRIASATSSWRRGCRSSSGAASRTTSCSTLAIARRAPPAGGARAAGAPDAGRRPLASAGDQLRRRSGCTCATSTSITPDMRLFPDFDDNLRQAFRQETELLRREHPARGSQRARPAARRLHVPQRAAGQALRHPARLRQPLPPRHARRATASAAACSARAAS